MQSFRGGQIEWSVAVRQLIGILAFLVDVTQKILPLCNETHVPGEAQTMRCLYGEGG